MRLFIAVDLSNNVRRAVADVIRLLRGRLPSTSWAHRIRWVPTQNLHLTMSFLGHVDEDLAVTVSHALAEPLTTTEFRVSIFGAGAFPCKGLPRIIWLGVGNGSAQLVALRNEIGGRLKPLGFDVGAHEYSAHLTLGRVKVRSGRAERIIRQLLVSASAAIEPWSVDHITLYESELLHGRSTYQPLVCTRLTKMLRVGHST